MQVKKGRINCITLDYPPMLGGVARYLNSLVVASDFKINILVPLEHPDLQGVQFKRVNFWWQGWPRWLPLIKRVLELKNDGALLVSHVFPVGTAAWLASLIHGPEYYVLFHGTDLQRVNNRWKLWLLRRICQKAKGLLTNSQSTKKKLQRLVKNQKIDVITPGVWMPRKIDKVICREQLGISEDAKIILSVCRLVERKGIEVLLQAMKEIKDKESNVNLVVVGQGSKLAAWQELARLLEVDVTWITDADDDLLNQWYAASDIFCLPGQEKMDDIEGFGIVYLEAAAHGLPVVAGQGGGVSEAVLDGVTGLVVSPTIDNVSNALLRLLRNYTLCMQMGRAGSQRAERDFGWRDRWEKLEKIVLGEQVFNFSKDIAIVIPCWNHAKELEQTLNAICAQSLQPAEILVVDDASDDDPRSVVVKFQDRLPIKYLRNEKNMGAPAARNKGARLTSAGFIMFLDAEVILEKDALLVMRQALEDNFEVSFVYSDFYWAYKLFKVSDYDLEKLHKCNYIHTTALIRRAHLVTFDESITRFQDWDLWLTMAEKGHSGIHISKVLFKVLAERKIGMSKWLPAFVYRLHWPILGWTPLSIVKYREAEKIIRQKHKI